MGFVLVVAITAGCFMLIVLLLCCYDRWAYVLLFDICAILLVCLRFVGVALLLFVWCIAFGVVFGALFCGVYGWF